MKKLSTVFLVLLVLLASACSPEPIPIADGQVFAIHLGTTLWGMQQALASKTGTFIMERGGSYLFFWNLENAWCFKGVTESQRAIEDIKAITGGNLVSGNTMREIKSFMESQGWKLIPAAEVPISLSNSITTAAQSIYTWAASTVTFLLVPPGLFEMPEGVEVKDGPL